MTQRVEYLDLEDFLTIAEHITGTSRPVLEGLPRIGLAESALASPAAAFGGDEAYPEFRTKAAVLLVHLSRIIHCRTGTRAARTSPAVAASSPLSQTLSSSTCSKT